MTELSPCPFCGSKATFASVGEWYSVGCISVQCRGDWFMSKPYEDKEKAAEEWNTRAERTCKDVAIEGEWFECSECGTVKQLIHPHYCPNCGAKVVG